MSAKNFNVVKQDFLRFADVLRKANTADELRALLLADIGASYHSYDMLDLLTVAEDIGFDLAECMGQNLDEHGAPNGN